MGRRSVGLQKELSTILDGVQIPEEAEDHDVTGGRTANEVAERARPDPIALFEEIARAKRRQASIWLRLRRIFSTHPEKHAGG